MQKISKRSLSIFIIVMMILILPVTASAAKVKLAKAKLNITTGKTYELKLKGTSKKVKWSISKKAVATIKPVSKNTVQITGKKAGTATVTAKVGKKSYQCKLTIKDKPQLSKKKLTLKKGENYTLKLTGTSAASKWSSSKKSVAAIKKRSKYAYKITAKKKGTTYVNVKVGRKTLKCKITVINPPKSETTDVQTETKPIPDTQPSTEAPQPEMKPTPETQPPTEAPQPETNPTPETQPSTEAPELTLRQKAMLYYEKELTEISIIDQFALIDVEDTGIPKLLTYTSDPPGYGNYDICDYRFGWEGKAFIKEAQFKVYPKAHVLYALQSRQIPGEAHLLEGMVDELAECYVQWMPNTVQAGLFVAYATRWSQAESNYESWNRFISGGPINPDENTYNHFVQNLIAGDTPVNVIFYDNTEANRKLYLR